MFSKGFFDGVGILLKDDSWLSFYLVTTQGKNIDFPKQKAYTQDMFIYPSVNSDHDHLAGYSDFSACPGGSLVSVSDSWPGGCEFDTWFR